MDKAYALLNVKSVDAERRTFSGIASTPELDRQGDSVDPAGVRFRNPLPLLFHHDQTQPIGTAMLSAKPTGIHFTATLPFVNEPGRLKDRVDDAWHSIKAGVITGVSIGYRLLDNAIEHLAAGGRRLRKTEVFELSLVTIPANVSATILSVKHLALAHQLDALAPVAPQEAPRMKDVPLPRLSDVTRQQVREQQSIDFVKYLGTLAETRGSTSDAVREYLERYPESFSASSMRKMLEGNFQLAGKAATAPGTSTDATWAKPLIGVEQLAAGFLAVAHSRSLLGRLGLELIPANVKIPFQTGEANFVWVSESFLAPVSKLSFSDGITLPPTKAVGIVVLSAELIKLTTAGTATAIRNALMKELNSFLDKQFLSTTAAVTGTNPAGILNGLTPLVGTADAVASAKALKAAFYTASPGSERPVIIANGNYAGDLRGMNPGFGYEIIASEAAANNLIMLDPERVFYADGGLEIDYSEYANLEMADPATNPPTASTVMTSLWQQNLAGYRLTRFASWGKAPSAVAYSTMP